MNSTPVFCAYLLLIFFHESYVIRFVNLYHATCYASLHVLVEFVAFAPLLSVVYIFVCLGQIRSANMAIDNSNHGCLHL